VQAQTRAEVIRKRKVEVLEFIRTKIVKEQTYHFGTEATFSLKNDEGLILKCTKNVDHIEEVLICLTSRFSESKVIYIYCMKNGESFGGGSRLPRLKGAYRPIDKAIAISRWTVSNEGIKLKFMITDNRRAANQRFRELIKDADVSLGSNWNRTLDLDLLRLTGDERTEIFVRLWTLIKYNFANFDLVGELDWDQILEEYLPLVRRDQSIKEFGRLLRRCVASLKDGHTDVSVKYFSAFEGAQPLLRIEAVEGKAVITEVGETDEISKAELKRGDEILRIDGRSVSEILQNDIYPYVFASTTQGRDVQAYRYLLKGPHDSKVSLRIRKLGGQESDVVLTRLGDWMDEMPAEEFGDFEYRRLSEDMAYVAINTFGSEEVVEEFDEHMDNIRVAKGLIIDVRKNSGGSSSNGNAIISRLIRESIPGVLWTTPQHIAAFEAWGRPQPWYKGEPQVIEPYQEGAAYEGAVVILVGPETFSAAEDFVVPLHACRRAIVVGERTGGSTGQPLRFRFYYGVRGRICTKRDTYPDEREFVGVGIIPDVEAHRTREDIASDRDAVMEKGIEVLKRLFSTETTELQSAL
jgi:C-terminal processing protease CtpA/Prc